ncbi:MAG: histidinol-phosphatase HisJ family protein [Oscillospiraceae bacterium]|jgi:histidinol-phosphatase (PHP family)|nr:histidinol-phosphatase HisJ family protein [Oscillospiraceae bacterium]
MPHRNLLDQHAHTDNSFDGHHSVVFLCETAVERGLRALAFTDHVEMDHFRDQGFDRTAQQSFVEILKARSAFRGRLIVCAGVELGQPTYNLPESEHLLQRYSYDIVVGSIHNLRGKPDFWFLHYDEMTDGEIAALLRDYFGEVLGLVAWGKFDVLAHLTYPLRYLCGEAGRKVDLADYAGQIDEILGLVVRRGISLEINTSGLRQKLNETMPSEAILRRYKALGGKKITIGSDAHYAQHLGAGLPEGMELARRCGFTHVQLYQGREAMPIPLLDS